MDLAYDSTTARYPKAVIQERLYRYAIVGAGWNEADWERAWSDCLCKPNGEAIEGAADFNDMFAPDCINGPSGGT